MFLFFNFFSKFFLKLFSSFVSLPPFRPPRLLSPSSLSSFSYSCFFAYSRNHPPPLKINSQPQKKIRWWTFEAIVLMSGLILPDPAPAVAATGIGFQTVTIAYSLALGMAAASATRVGNELGAGNPARGGEGGAGLDARDALPVVGGGLGALRRPRRMGQALHLRRRCAGSRRNCAPLTAAAIVGDGVNGALGGCVRGAGRQESRRSAQRFLLLGPGDPRRGLTGF